MESSRSLVILSVAMLFFLFAFLGLVPMLVPTSTISTQKAGLPQTWDPDDPLFKTDEERFERPRRKAVAPVRRAKVPDPLAEDWVPRTRAERAWAATWQQRQREAAVAAAEQESFDRFRGFLDSSAGGQVQAAFELVRRGKAAEGAALFKGQLDEILRQPEDVQRPLLKSSIRLFKEAGDFVTMGRVLVAYLEGIERHLEDVPQEGRARENYDRMIEEVREMLAQARRKAAEVSG